MNINPTRFNSVLALTLLAASTAATAGITGTSPAAAADYQKYSVDPSDSTKLIPDNSASLPSVLAGNATLPGGNVELFTSSDTMSNSAYNAYHQTTSLVGTLGSSTLTLSSLNTNDWGSTLPGGKTLLQTWVGELLSKSSLPTDPATVGTISGLFQNNGGEQRFSDPNIAYAYTENGQIHIGLAGFYDAKAMLMGAVASLPAGPQKTAIQAALAGLGMVQISELVKVNYAGATQYLYGFYADPSGVSSGDPNESFGGIFDITHPDPNNTGSAMLSLNTQVPEPSSLLLMAMAFLGLAFDKKRTV